MFAGVAQSVVQLIRNQQVVCSSHITSSIFDSSVRPGCFGFCGRSLVAEHRLPKPNVRVRFPSPAPRSEFNKLSYRKPFIGLLFWYFLI